MSESLEELSQLSEHLDSWRRTSRRPHPDEYKAVVEHYLRHYFARALPDVDVKEGYRKRPKGTNQQLDIVVRQRPASARGGLFESASILLSRAGFGIAHVEVAFAKRGASASYLWRKLRTDLDRIDQSSRLATAVGKACSTGLALIGDGWSEHDEALLAHIHEHYCRKGVTRVRLTNRSWHWPVPYFVVTHRWLLVKSELFSSRSTSSKAYPAWHLWPASGSDDDERVRGYRPLSIARGYLKHVVDRRTKRKRADSPAFGDSTRAAVVGPPPEAFAIRAPYWNGHLVAVLAIDRGPELLHQPLDFRARTWASLLRDKRRCRYDSRYRYVWPQLHARYFARSVDGRELYMPLPEMKRGEG